MKPVCVWLSCALLALAVGATSATQPPPEVTVAKPLVNVVTDFEDYVGRIEPSTRVDLKARATGPLLKVHFQEGEAVKQGDLLFEIDPRPYQAEVQKSEAVLAQGEASLKHADTDFNRAKQLFAAKTITQEELEKYAAKLAEAKAALTAAATLREIAKLQLEFTRVTAPVSGRIGRRLVDPGNLVKADDTLLATLVVTAPAHVYFDAAEKTILALHRAAKDPKAPLKGLPVLVGLADEAGFPHAATVDLIDTEARPGAGTLRLRATLPNPKGLLLPGLSARVRITTGAPHQALLVPVKSVSQSKTKGVAYLSVLTKDNELEERKVTLGSRHGDMWEVRTGLDREDWVALSPIGRFEQFRGGKVTPKKITLTDKEPGKKLP